MFTKKYCCSNESQTVAKILAVIDIAFSVMAILLFSCFVHIYLNYPESLHTMTEERPERQEDLIKFLTWGPQKQALMLSIPFTGSFVNLFKGSLLLIGAIKRHLKAIKLWLILTIVFMVSSMLFFIIELIFTQDKAFMVFLFLVDSIYEVYSIWVVKCLFHELRLETRSQYTHSTNVTPASYKSEQDLDIDTELTTSIDKF